MFNRNCLLSFNLFTSDHDTFSYELRTEDKGTIASSLGETYKSMKNIRIVGYNNNKKHFCSYLQRNFHKTFSTSFYLMLFLNGFQFLMLQFKCLG